MKKEYSPIRKLREELDLNQFEFGRLIGRAEISIRHYEKNLAIVPKDVLEKMKKIAAQKGYADIALELSGEDWEIRTIYPPREFEEKQKTRADGSPGADKDWHALLDRALSSADHGLVAILKGFLSYFEVASNKKASGRNRAD